MPAVRNAIVVILFGLMACESPEGKITRLQSELLTALGERDYFEIKTGNQIQRLPLPPSPDLAESRKIKIAEINLETYSFENEQLNQKDQLRLKQLCSQLNEIVKRGNGAFFDPAKCVLVDSLLEVVRRGDQVSVQVLLQKIPEYYAEVERRWQTPDAKHAQIAAAQSILVLDALEQVQGNTATARLAVKDFIGLCNSAVLEH